MRRADRLIRITQFLRAQSRAVTAERIAEEFEVSARTVYRDMADLMISDVPVSGEPGVGYMIDKRFYMPPVAFDADEMEATALGIAMVGQWTDAAFAGHAASALAKIAAVLPKEKQGELDQIATWSIPGTPVVPWTISFTALREAIRERSKVHIDYRDGDGRQSTRIVRPLALIFASPVWVLAAWCETRRGYRNFRLDRIAGAETTADTFALDAEVNLDAYRAADRQR